MPAGAGRGGGTVKPAVPPAPPSGSPWPERGHLLAPSPVAVVVPVVVAMAAFAVSVVASLLVLSGEGTGPAVTHWLAGSVLGVAAMLAARGAGHRMRHPLPWILAGQAVAVTLAFWWPGSEVGTGWVHAMPAGALGWLALLMLLAALLAWWTAAVPRPARRRDRMGREVARRQRKTGASTPNAGS